MVWPSPFVSFFRYMVEKNWFGICLKYFALGWNEFGCPLHFWLCIHVHSYSFPNDGGSFEEFGPSGLGAPAQQSGHYTTILFGLAKARL